MTSAEEIREEVPESIADGPSCKKIAWLSIDLFSDVDDMPDFPDDMSTGELMTYLIIRKWGPMRKTDVLNGLGLSPGHLYPAIEQFEEDGLVETRPSLVPRRSDWVWMPDYQDPPDREPPG